MKVVSMEDHDFHKVNLVTQTKGDYYKCSVCGCEGWRNGLSGSILVTDARYKKSKSCTFLLAKENSEPKKSVLVFTKELYEVTNSPWKKDLPEGTIIEKTVRNGEEDWFIRLDRKDVVNSKETDGCFKLYSNERRELKSFTYEEALELSKI